MPDEAVTTYGAVINQVKQVVNPKFHGLDDSWTSISCKYIWDKTNKRLANRYSQKVKINVFIIDPFGASSAIPVIYRLAGLDGHIIDRISNKVFVTGKYFNLFRIFIRIKRKWILFGGDLLH